MLTGWPAFTVIVFNLILSILGAESRFGQLSFTRFTRLPVADLVHGRHSELVFLALLKVLNGRLVSVASDFRRFLPLRSFSRFSISAPPSLSGAFQAMSIRSSKDASLRSINGSVWLTVNSHLRCSN
jgi:hypothetical protein